MNGLWLVLGSLVFVGGGLVVLQSENWDNLILWACVAFFSLCLIVGLAQTFGPRGTLRLSPIGYETVTLGRQHSEKWTDIGEIGFGRVQARTMILFDYTQEKLMSSPSLFVKSAGVSKAMVGFHGALPSLYGQKAVDLTHAMEIRRNAAVRLSGSS